MYYTTQSISPGSLTQDAFPVFPDILQTHSCDTYSTFATLEILSRAIMTYMCGLGSHEPNQCHQCLLGWDQLTTAKLASGL